jgi:16S rRNA (cytosine1402-N4)-methyltransferase
MMRPRTRAGATRSSVEAADPPAAREHVPVLRAEVVDLLTTGGKRFIDATVGAGGHAAALLAATPDAQLLGLDADPQALVIAEQRLATDGQRVRLTQGNFSNLKTIARAHGWERADGILLDLGLSSRQLADDTRGFSFSSSGPLDLRFDPTGDRPTAIELVCKWDTDELARVIWEYGEERWSRRIARAITAARPPTGVWSARDFARVAVSGVPRQGRKRRRHPATRTFQALRIAVNGELDALKAVLPQAIRLLDTSGRLAVISYHSLEDRLVKQAFRVAAGVCQCPPEVPVCSCGASAEVRLVTRRVVRPSAAEIKENARSRSARLRVVERLPITTAAKGHGEAPEHRRPARSR